MSGAIQNQKNPRRTYIMKEKVVLAYSGGLDTTALIPWLKETFDYDVVCCCVNCGQGNELDGLEERAKMSGASKLYIEDIVDEFCDDFIMPCVEAGAVYEHSYLLGTSMARPVIAKKLVEIARKEGAVAICHGATGKGNDQIRFELGIKALAPDIKIIAPWRMTDLWTMQSREDEIEFCKAHGITLPFDASHSYSRDRNLWHISHEGLELEDPSQAPNYDDMLVLSVTPEKAPDKETEITMTFEQGVPKTLNGKAMKVSEIITELNKLGGENGIGIVDIVENRVVGMKSRGVYETPGGTILMAAHDQLEELILDRETMEAKKKLGSQFAQVVYEGNGTHLSVRLSRHLLSLLRNMLPAKLNSSFTKETSSRMVQPLRTAFTMSLSLPSQPVICMITMMQTDSSLCSVCR